MEERLYDLIFIVRPATPEEEIKKVLTSLEHACAEKGAKIEKSEHWGTRKLAYKVMKHREGIYLYQQVRTTHGELVHELERRLGVQDSVIKYQTVRRSEAPEEAFAEARAARRPSSAPHRSRAAAARGCRTSRRVVTRRTGSSQCVPKVLSFYRSAANGRATSER